MANRIVTLMDTDWRVQARITLSADTNASPGLTFIDISALDGWDAGSKLALSKIFWTVAHPSGAVHLQWHGTGGGSAASHAAIILQGNGTYGYQPGQPALLSDAVGTGAATGDLHIINAAAVSGTIIVECTKHVSQTGTGWGA